MGLIRERRSNADPNETTVVVHLSRADVETAIKGSVILTHPDEESESVGTIAEVEVVIAGV